MNSKIAAWRFCRAMRWLAWIVFFGWSAYFAWDKAPHLNSFGHPLLYTEAAFFGLGIAAIFIGFLELMMRDRAGIVRPGADAAVSNR